MATYLPGPISPDAFRTHFATKDQRLKVGVAVDAYSHGSPLQLGMSWIKPRSERDSWQADDRTHEAYYVIGGSVRLGWSGPEAGESVVHAGECFYFPPGRTYTIESAGEDEAFLIWTICS